MSAPKLRAWRQQDGTFVSPRFLDYTEFDRCKKYLIRATVQIDCDDAAKVIRINVSDTDSVGKKNIEKLDRLGLLP